MTRDEWLQAFIEELSRLRPHLKAGWGVSRIALAIAASNHDPAVEPATAARRWHQKNPPAAAKKAPAGKR